MVDFAQLTKPPVEEQVAAATTENAMLPLDTPNWRLIQMITAAHYQISVHTDALKVVLGLVEKAGVAVDPKMVAGIALTIEQELDKATRAMRVMNIKRRNGNTSRATS